MSLTVQNLFYSYGKEEVLHDLSFHADYGSFISVLGPNGVGKSTLFKCLLGIYPPDRGNILINGEDIRQLSPRKLAQKAAYIPQTHTQSFQYSVFDMVLMGTATDLAAFSAPGAAQAAKAEEALKRLGIAHLKNRSFTKISGGEQQLTLIARALAQDARILIMDEPGANLDFGNRLRVMQTMKRLAAEGCLIIQSTHDPEQAYMYSDAILALQNGKLLTYGSPAEVLTPKLLSDLYHVDVEICSLRNDRVRVCLPSEAVDTP